jgi:hypothetical protein
MSLHLRRLRLAGLAALLVSCATTPLSLSPIDENALHQAHDRLARGEIESTVSLLESFVSATERDPLAHPRERFFAEYLLAHAHTTASLDPAHAAFLTETRDRSAVGGGIGRREASRRGERVPSPDAHLVATIYHAGRARGMFDAARRQGAKREAALPDALREFPLEDADARLQLLQTIAYARLGFRERVSEILGRTPDLLAIESCFVTLDRYRLPDELRPWVCEIVFHHLEELDEPTAFRFGVFAVEGADRFGLALPPDAIEAIDDWIVHDAKRLFVCPESRTPYIPGERRSPISGIPHLDYIAVERPPGKEGVR